MAGYNFTDQVRLALQMARDEAMRLHHEYVGTEHLLLGLLLCDHCVAVTILTSLRCDFDAVRADIAGAVRRGDPSTRHGPDLPYTARAKKVLELAMTEARELAHEYVGTEHLLLGLVREEKNIAAQVLHKHGVSAEPLRAATLLQLRGGQRDRPARPLGPRAAVTAVTVTLELANGQLAAARFRSPQEAIDYLTTLERPG